jgi:hypothetical protein
VERIPATGGVPLVAEGHITRAQASPAG